MSNKKGKYFWPASRLTEADMNLLYRVRQSRVERVPITELLARAVRDVYGRIELPQLPESNVTTPRQEAA